MTPPPRLARDRGTSQPTLYNFLSSKTALQSRAQLARSASTVSSSSLSSTDLRADGGGSQRRHPPSLPEPVRFSPYAVSRKIKAPEPRFTFAEETLTRSESAMNSSYDGSPFLIDDPSDWQDADPLVPSAAPAAAPKKTSKPRVLPTTFQTAVQKGRYDGPDEMSVAPDIWLNNGTTKKVKAKSTTSTVELSLEQIAVLELVVNRRQSIFFTGSAGTGKSLLLREIIRQLRNRPDVTSEQIQVTAPTGIAATNINGCTLHSFAGVGLANQPVNQLVGMVYKNKRALQRWRGTKVLIIDEISMVDCAFFDKLEEMARSLRGNEQPFGGIQLVICGDFMQLPPVSKALKKYAFEAASWSRCVTKTILLKRVFRQRDQAFVDILNEMRTGQISEKTCRILCNLNREPKRSEFDPEPTALFALRQQVDQANEIKLNQLEGHAESFDAHDHGEPRDVLRLDENCLAPKILKVKIGAQVMLIKNVDSTLVNGTMGRVLGFDVDDKNEVLPIVEFMTGVNRDTPRRLLVARQDWSIETASGKVVATRRQIPLVLAYALSIHKSQGQTLDFVRVDLGKVFEKGQAYVALSRCTSIDGLQVLNFSKEKVMADPKVAVFHQQLSSIMD